jgi:hypothetical protein
MTTAAVASKRPHTIMRWSIIGLIVTTVIFLDSPNWSEIEALAWRLDNRCPHLALHVGDDSIPDAQQGAWQLNVRRSGAFLMIA